MYHEGLGSIRWGPFLDNAPRDLSYELIPEDEAGRVGFLSGVVSFDGQDAPIRGSSEIVTLPGDADPDGDVDLAGIIAVQAALTAGRRGSRLFPPCKQRNF